MCRPTVSCAPLLLALVASASHAQSAVDSPSLRQTEERFGSYVYAYELGSGIYDLAGRTLQVYRIPFSRELREPSR